MLSLPCRPTTFESYVALGQANGPEPVLGHAGKWRSTSRKVEFGVRSLAFYFFDIWNKGLGRQDDVGIECKTMKEVQLAALAALAAAVEGDIPLDKDGRIAVFARDRQGEPFYAATVSYVQLVSRTQSPSRQAVH
jgi:hypothetical protein